MGHTIYLKAAECDVVFGVLPQSAKYKEDLAEGLMMTQWAQGNQLSVTGTYILVCPSYRSPNEATPLDW